MGNIVVFKNFSNFSEYLNQKNFILLDGATGTLIQKSGVKYDHVPEVLNITHPELIESFHRRYIDAGSDIGVRKHLRCKCLQASGQRLQR